MEKINLLQAESRETVCPHSLERGVSVCECPQWHSLGYKARCYCDPGWNANTPPKTPGCLIFLHPWQRALTNAEMRGPELMFL